MKTLRQRQYLLLRRHGYTAAGALCELRMTSNYYWQKMLFGCMNTPRLVAAGGQHD